MISGQAFQPCGNHWVHQQLENKYPGITELIDKTYENALQTNLDQSRDVLQIPVVVHVVFNDAEQNVSDELIQSQIDVLNEDFRRLNENASDTRDIFLSRAGDAEIEFYLADIDPMGNPSNGITRTETDKTSFVDLDIAALLAALVACGVDITDPDITDEQLECIFNEIGGFDLDAMKSSETGGIEPWDTEKYMNIWVCNMAIDFFGTSTPFILGFAYPPIGAPNWPEGTLPPEIEQKDGVVIHYQAFGRNNPANGPLAGLNDQGRTGTHEVGHYLGLRHIWGDGDCTMDDGLDDTPTAATNSQPTDATIPTCMEMHTKDSCLEDAEPDMIENYMDYSLESCQNMFTQQQVDLMRAMLEGPRVGLLDGLSNVLVSEEASLSIFPNPSTSQVFIETSLAIKSIQVTNAAGHIVISENGSANGYVDVSNVRPGIYFLHVSFHNGNHKITKLLKL